MSILVSYPHKIHFLLIHESLCDYYTDQHLDSVDTVIPMGKSSKLKLT